MTQVIQTSEAPVKDFTPVSAAESYGRRYSKIFFDIFNRYSFGVSPDGKIVDTITNKQVRLNMVRCLLRNDYLSRPDAEIHGSLLTGMIDAFLRGLFKAVEKAGKDHPELMRAVDISDRFI